MARTVLVADDSPTHQRRASGILTGEGLEVVTVSNGVAAIKKLPALKPTVVLADVSMPGRDGYEVCEFVKNSPELAHVPVLLIFSDLEPYDEQRAARVHADGKIRKPFGQEELVSAVSRFLVQVEEVPPAPPPAAPPQPAVVTEPVDLEPQVSTRESRAALEALPEGVAFVTPGMEEAVAPPATFPPGERWGEEPAAQEPMPSPEEPVAEKAWAPELAPAAEEPAVEEEAPPAALGGEPAFEEPAPAAAEIPPAVEEQAAPEPPPESVREEPEPPVEPVLVEEAAPAAAPEGPSTAERTMVFRMPVEIAEPVLADELAPAPAVEAAPPPAPEAPPAVEPPAPATTLEGYSLTDASAGQVRIAPPEGEAAPEPTLAPAIETAEPPLEAAAPMAAPIQTLDYDLIYWIVHNVVTKMSPPRLSAQAVEDMARLITDEVVAELSAETPPSE